jgi:signal transduction histidine kinase
MRGPHTLRARLFFWFVGAILLAMVTGSLVAWRTRPESIVGTEQAARHVEERLLELWDDPAATGAFVQGVREVTGFDVQLVRDPSHLRPRVRRLAENGAVFVSEGPQHVALPVLRGKRLLGALEIQGFGQHVGPWAWWRVAAALMLVVALLSAMAGAVANQLAHPLERLARAADRFGAGDLTVRADAARRVRWVAREVRAVAISFNRMADRVEATVRGQRELLGAISHELRSPLGRAHVALEIARDRLPPQEGERSAAAAIDDVEKQLLSVDSILGDLLDVTRAGLADLRLETRPFGLWLRERIEAEPPAPPIDLQLEATAADAAVRFDSGLLERVVHNLVVNARAHGHPPDRPLEVRLSLEGRGNDAVLRVAVRDRGAGFPEGFIERAFEPFVRGDTARSRPSEGPGHGFGLAIVKRIVEAHGGRVFARNLTSGPSPAAGAVHATSIGATPETPRVQGAEVGFELPLRGPKS